MGFKRTTEGRVFFQGADQQANDEESQQQTGYSGFEDAPRPLQQNTQHSQVQILALLKALNERLKTTQAERNRMRLELDAYRSIIEDLEGKSDKAERSFLELEEKILGKESTAESRAAEAEKIARETMQELEETRKLLLEIEGKADRADKNLSTLISVQKDQAQKMTGAATGYKMLADRLQETEARQQEIGGKVDETMSQHARLARKMDKAIEDRTRFMRKIERIEETVLQMRDTLNARAMVLLTDQNAAVQTLTEDSGIITQAQPQIAQNASAAAVPAPNNLPMQAAALLTLALIAAMAGWLFTQIRADESGPAIIESNVAETSVAIQPAAEREIAPPPEQLQQAQDWTVTENTEAFSETAPIEEEMQPVEETAAVEDPAAPDMATVDDIGAVNLQSNEEVLALLESNPDALAAQLNAIEPGTAEVIEETMQTASVDPATANPEATAPAQPAQPPRVAAAPLEAPKQPAKPLSSASPDSNLPGPIKEIENQAFNGVPEAQHDLAAIYTAGHAGVKQNYQKAAFWFRQAADKGVANARYNLGVLYHQGLGVKQDVQEALRWYKAAADLGHPEAQYNLGIAYIEGIGVPYDPVQASQYFENAADTGVTEAAYNLGLIYENGLLGQAKPDVALMWYKNAADKGSPEATAALEQLAKTLNISRDEVNKLVEGMKGTRQSAGNKGAQAAQPPAAPAAAPAQKEKTSSAAQVALTPAVSDVAAAAPAESDYQRQQQEQVIIAQVQEYLMRVGLYPGPADGARGPLTEDAIRSYQSVNNLHVDGRATEDLLTHMLANASGNKTAADTSEAFDNLN